MVFKLSRGQGGYVASFHEVTAAKRKPRELVEAMIRPLAKVRIGGE